MNLVQFVESGGAVRLLGQPLEERLTPRQLRFLFATGAFAAGKAAAKAVRAVAIPAPSRSDFGIGLGAHNASSLRTRQAISTAVRRTAARAAAKQAMSQQLRSYKAAKGTAIQIAKLLVPRVVMPKQRFLPMAWKYGNLGAARKMVRQRMRASVK